MKKFLLALSSLVASVSPAIEYGGDAPPPEQPLSLWYKRPAEQWIEALPVGNGRLGAMVFGGVARERLQLNEDTLWAGGPYDPVSPEAAAALPDVRRLVFEGKYREADQLISEKVMARPLRQMAYQTVGDVHLDFGEVGAIENYRRELDLDAAVARVSYVRDGVRFTREVFSSPVDQVIVVRITADQPRRIGFTATLQTPQRASVSAEGGDTLVLAGVNSEYNGVAGALRFEARVRVVREGGNQFTLGSSLTVQGADSVTLLVSAATSFRRFDDVSGDPTAANLAVLEAAQKKDYASLLADHTAEHQRLFRRVALDLGSSPASASPTDVRIRNFATTGEPDPALATLYFQYGRYLLISSSRPGTQPANLQGIWNDSMSPPWQSKYTININTEMNYWPAEPTNLAECVEPLVRMVEELAVTGAHTAKTMYGARGWVVHHNTDLWRAAAPIDGPRWGMWPTGGAWLALHLWDHYEYAPNPEFLARMYPVLKGAAEFFLDTLVEDPKSGYLVTNPSTSPENAHPFGSAVCAGPAMDSQILRDLFLRVEQCAELLGVDGELRRQVAATRARLAPDKIGAQGQLQEWLEDWDAGAPEQDHRHVSHLYAFFPSNQITLRGTPELASGVRKTLETRGDFSTGWAIAWRLNLWARLQDGERTHRILKALLEPSRTYPNMFDAHPPFQIDGNFGGTNAIAEMLLQTHTGEIELLPALPAAWPTGSVRGLRARGGFEVDLAWADGKLAHVDVRSTLGGEALLRYGDKTVSREVAPGGAVSWDGR
ncbi:glycoside hydrolase family 95 protein [Opitutales bacterium ASA1]|uniref:glycoside hydrolase family 95 protein n=1 Tax=Congregicoccus parvus TaxID=3081749 RepID=UPI002B2A28EA|nr:glycoside hydrolase family 95 protein [Opitutales bacterium ASA1]